MTEPRERPILFNAEMVRALWDSRKQQSRRPIDRLVGFGAITEFGPSDTPGYDWQFRDKRMLWNELTHDELLQRAPLGQPGDLLWVRESFLAVECDCQAAPAALRGGCKYCGGIGETAIYKADATCFDKPGCCAYKPSIHMPRWASRLTLKITGVRVERVQDISEADAEAEGVFRTVEGFIKPGSNPIERIELTHRDYFRDLWQSLYGPEAWTANGWVWVYEFERFN